MSGVALAYRTYYPSGAGPVREGDFVRFKRFYYRERTTMYLGPWEYGTVIDARHLGTVAHPAALVRLLEGVEPVTQTFSNHITVKFSDLERIDPVET